VSIKAIEGGLGDLSIDDSNAVALSTDTFDTFNPFPELATELRLKTWGYAAAEPKVVEIVWEDSQNCWKVSARHVFSEVSNFWNLKEVSQGYHLVCERPRETARALITMLLLEQR
jgi:hypothetical protein